MVSHVALWRSLPEENIVQQGTPEVNSKIYFIAEGTCDVIVINHMRQKELNHKHNILSTGEFFGEVSLLFPCLRTATVKS